MIVRFSSQVEFLGELWGTQYDEELRQHADKAMSDLKGALESAGFDVRAGEIVERERVPV